MIWIFLFYLTNLPLNMFLTMYQTLALICLMLFIMILRYDRLFLLFKVIWGWNDMQETSHRLDSWESSLWEWESWPRQQHVKFHKEVKSETIITIRGLVWTFKKKKKRKEKSRWNNSQMNYQVFCYLTMSWIFKKSWFILGQFQSGLLFPVTIKCQENFLTMLISQS